MLPQLFLPACHHTTHCAVCGTGVVGKFELSPFYRISPESLKFQELFVRNRGVDEDLLEELRAAQSSNT